MLNLFGLKIVSVCAILLSCSDANTHNTYSVKSQSGLNQKPTALAGHDLRVKENAIVRLNGAAIDVDGNIKNMTWRQVSRGLDIVFNQSSRSDISFTAPNVEEDQILTFELSVIDNDDAITTDTVNVLIMK